MKVLISAFACRPGEGSEPGAGWAWAHGAARRHDVWLLAIPADRPHIEAGLAKDRSLRLTPVYLDVPRVLPTALRRASSRAYDYHRYLAWQREVARVGARLHADHRFDVGHHLTYAVDWLPAGIAWVPGLPVVWGPVGGTTGTAPRLWPHLGLRTAAGEIARSTSSAVIRRLAGDATARRAVVTVAQNPDVARRFARFGPVVTEPHIALPPSSIGRSQPGSPRPGARHRAVFVGRLVGWKGLRLAISAMAHPAAAGWTLDVIGDGREAEPARNLIGRLALEDRVTLRGRLPRAAVLDEFGSADCLFLPSVHDAAGWVVAEAFAEGVPVVCLDRGGPGFLVDDNRGRKVPGSAAVISRLAEALRDVPDRFAPVNPWSTERIPDVLDEWYTAARGENPHAGRWGGVPSRSERQTSIPSP